jgi:hypothetical protein
MNRLWLILAILLFAAAETRAEKKAVSFNAPDGFTFKGAFYTAGKAGPGVLLLHECNVDRQVYDDLGTMLSTAGYDVLALDFRGGGEPIPGDVDTALMFLTSQAAVNSNALGINRSRLRGQPGCPCGRASSNRADVGADIRRRRCLGCRLYQEFAQDSDPRSCQ